MNKMSSVARASKYTYRASSGGIADVNIEYSADLTALTRLEVKKRTNTHKHNYQIIQLEKEKFGMDGMMEVQKIRDHTWTLGVWFIGTTCYFIIEFGIFCKPIQLCLLDDLRQLFSDEIHKVINFHLKLDYSEYSTIATRYHHCACCKMIIWLINPQETDLRQF